MNRSIRSAAGIGFLVSVFLLLSGCELIEPMPGEEVGTAWYPMTEVCPAGETIEGIDVSVYQDTIDWDTVAGAGIEFAIMRASVADNEDTRFDFNWPEARRVGIIRGAYHYFYPDVDAALQAETFLAAVGTLEPDDLPPTLDVEEQDGVPPPDTYAALVREWLDLVEAGTGRVPMIYTGAYHWETYVQAADMADHPLWAAHWGVTCPLVPDPWTGWVFHQYEVGDYGAVPGITTRIDRDVFNGDMAALLDFVNFTPECGDGFCNGDETHESCPGDCPVCEPIPPEGRIVDETEICFEKGGPPQYWRTEAAGWNDSLFWTHTTDDAEVANFAVWSFDFEEAGQYRLEAYTAAPWAESRQAAYVVTHAGAEDTVTIDQSAVDGWSLIGDFSFAAGADQSVYLGDNTGEPVGGETQIVADAVRLTRLDQPEETAEETVADEPRPETPDTTERPDTADVAVDDVQVDDAGADGDVSTDTEGGCGCSLAR